MLDFLSLRVVVVVILAAQISWPAAAQKAATQSCDLLVSEARFEFEELREEERLAPIGLTADQAIFELLEPLWEARSTERLRYLAAKHARDRSRISVEQAAIATNRAAVKLEVLTRECFAPEANPGKAPGRFEALGCELIRKEKEIAAVDFAYRKEVLESTNELRRLEFATAQDLIRAQFNLNLARAQLRSRTRRLGECAKPAPRTGAAQQPDDAGS